MLHKQFAWSKKKPANNAGLYLCREEGIRTLDRVAPIPAFQAGPFNHSGTSLLEGAKLIEN